MKKTPDYTRRAIDNYNSKFDRITVNFPKGTKERIKELTGQTAGGFAVNCVIEKLEQIEKEQAEQEQATGAATWMTPPAE